MWQFISTSDILCFKFSQWFENNKLNNYRLVEDFFAFEATVGDSFVISNLNSELTDPISSVMVMILDDAFEVVAVTIFYADDTSNLAHIALATGTYYLYFSQSASYFGDYRFSLTLGG
jgi:hypothetical protein